MVHLLRPQLAACPPSRGQTTSPAARADLADLLTTTAHVAEARQVLAALAKENTTQQAQNGTMARPLLAETPLAVGAPRDLLND